MCKIHKKIHPNVSNIVPLLNAHATPLEPLKLTSISAYKYKDIARTLYNPSNAIPKAMFDSVMNIVHDSDSDSESESEEYIEVSCLAALKQQQATLSLPRQPQQQRQPKPQQQTQLEPKKQRTLKYPHEIDIDEDVKPLVLTNRNKTPTSILQSQTKAPLEAVKPKYVSVYGSVVNESIHDGTAPVYLNYAKSIASNYYGSVTKHSVVNYEANDEPLPLLQHRRTLTQDDYGDIFDDML
jgi:hypothetical protein